MNALESKTHLKVLVTGADGFVGKVFCDALRKSGHFVREAVRKIQEEATEAKEKVGDASIDDIIEVGDIGAATDWSKALAEVDTVVHLAARVHVMQERSSDPLAAFRSVNVEGTERLAKMCAMYGIRRFVYVSSISIHGKSTGERAYVEEDEAQPHSPYAVSKWEGELVLKRVAREFGLELVVVRPPRGYGPGVGGSVLRLVRLAGHSTLPSG